MKSWKVQHFIPILWEPDFVEECTNVGVCIYLFRIISTMLILIWIDNPMKRRRNLFSEIIYFIL